MFLPRTVLLNVKNRTLVEMARTMLDEHKTPRRFWAEAINAACYVANRIFLRAFLGKTSYELRFGRPPKVSHFRVFGCKCFILKKGNLDKFESRSSDGLFLGYALQGRAYRVLNLATNRIEETCEVTFDETMPCFSSVFECAGDDEIGQNILRKRKRNTDVMTTMMIPSLRDRRSLTRRLSRSPPLLWKMDHRRHVHPQQSPQLHRLLIMYRL